MRAIIQYPGSKWRIAKWIIDHFSPHHSYLELFFGSGAVLFTKERSNIETVNDLDGNVVNFFEWVQKDPERLAKEIYWIPYARDVFEKACVQMGSEKDSFNRAVTFCTRMMMGYGCRTNETKVGWKEDVQGREAAYAAKQWCELPETILEAAERLRGVQIENRPALELIRRYNYPNVLVYADPPYIISTRYSKQYRHEMTDHDHEELLYTLREHRGPALVSGYDNPLYNEILKDWYRDEIQTTARSNTKRREVLWMNGEYKPMQRTLFT